MLCAVCLFLGGEGFNLDEAYQYFLPLAGRLLRIVTLSVPYDAQWRSGCCLTPLRVPQPHLHLLQVESTIAMQQIAPQVKQIQEQYKGRDQQEMQIKVAELYKKAGVNPLAGCLPTLATLPVWIGLYR